MVCVHHNVESQLLARRALLAGGRALRWYMRRQAELMQEAKARWASRVAVNVVVSAADGDRLASIAPTARIAVVPNGVDAVTLRPGPRQDERGILYVGGLNWFPNRDALADAQVSSPHSAAPVLHGNTHQRSTKRRRA